MMGRLATLMGCTEGQAYTIAIALALSLSMASLGLPPTLQSRAGTAELAGPGQQGDSSQQTLTPQEPSTQEEAGDTPAQLPDATRVGQEAADAGGGPDAPVGLGADPSGDGPPAAGGQPDDDGGFTLAQDESLEARFGAAQLFARVDEPGVPHGVVVGDDAVYVSTDNAPGRGESGASAVLRYTRDGERTGEIRLEGQDDTRLRGAPDVAVGADGAVLTVDPAAGRVLRLDLDGGEQHTHLELADLAPCALPTSGEACEPGAVSHPPRPVGLTVAPDGTLFVADAGQATVWRVERDGEAHPWHQDLDYRLGVPAHGGLAGLAFDRNGHLLLVVGSAVGEGPAAGALYRVETEPDGTAGSREQLLSTDPVAEPVDVAAGRSDRIYLTLSGEDQLLVLDEDGAEEARIGTDDVEPGAGVELIAPAGLAFHDDAVLIANSAPDDEEHWAVVRVAVEDAAAGTSP